MAFVFVLLQDYHIVECLRPMHLISSLQFFFFLKKVLGLLSSIGASFLPDCTYRSLDISYPALFRDCSNNSISRILHVKHIYKGTVLQFGLYQDTELA